MTTGILLYAQSGGVTAVINATASAVIETARARKVKVLAARNGILGALREEPVVEKGVVVPGTVMSLVLSCDASRIGGAVEGLLASGLLESPELAAQLAALSSREPRR